MFGSGGRLHGLIFLPLILILSGLMNRDMKSSHLAWGCLLLFVYCLVGQTTVQLIMDMLGTTGGRLFTAFWLILGVTLLYQGRRKKR